MSKISDFSKNTRNDYVYKSISEWLVVLGIDWTGDQCRERIKHLKTDCCPVRYAMVTLGTPQLPASSNMILLGAENFTKHMTIVHSVH